MNEKQTRGLVDRFASRAARHRDAARSCTYPEAAWVNDGWAACLEEAATVLVEALDGPQAARAFLERLTNGPGQSIEDARAEAQVRHLSEKDPNMNASSTGGAR